jgi:hypothetical protein
MAASVSWTEIPRNRENAGFGGRHFVEYSFRFFHLQIEMAFFDISGRK